MCRRLFHFEVPLNVALVLILLLPLYSIAQDSAQVSKDEQWEKIQAISFLQPGQLIRIRSYSHDDFIARFFGSDTDSLFATIDGRTSAVAISPIGALWVRGRMTKSGMRMGAIALGAFGIGLVSFSGSGTPSGRDLSNAVFIVLGGGILGGVLGAGIGAVIPKWHRRYIAKDYVPDSKRDRSKGRRLSILPGIHKGGMYVSTSLAF